MKYPHRLISLHDLHLGHDKTAAKDIIKRLSPHLTVEKLTGVDILYYAGDLFDQSLLLNEMDVTDIHLHLISVLEVCHVTRTKIRVLEGTPSHDCGQAKLFEALALNQFPDVDFKYINDMIIEYIEDFDIHVMYVPDEWASREAMYLKAVSLLKEHGLEQVDFIIGHNQFSYQYLEHLRSRVSALNEEDWVKMVKHHAFFGHIHTRSSYKKIQVAGSFDRLAHGEESTKGFLICDYYSDDSSQVTFVENTGAQCYRTLKIKNTFDYTDTDDFIELKNEINGIVNGLDIAYIRLKYGNKDIPVVECVRQLKPIFPHVSFSTLLEGDDVDDDKKSSVLPDEEIFDYIDIQKDNIFPLVESELNEDDDRESIMSLLTTLVNEVTKSC